MIGEDYIGCTTRHYYQTIERYRASAIEKHIFFKIHTIDWFQHENLHTRHSLVDVRCLKLNDDKTESLITGTPRTTAGKGCPSFFVSVGNLNIPPVPIERNLCYLVCSVTF